MPNRDRTGPMGMGPLTGRGLGPCGSGLRRGLGFGYGRGFGRGLGRFFGWNQPQTEAEQKQALVDYRKALEEELEDVKKEENDLK
ncbi:MAG: DUF5320 domain-containing protein [Candidatus Shapirobacteria bacterium]|nr:DUF5320 domain-containing protein [Candidatus Shapirobacteria bacterium]